MRASPLRDRKKGAAWCKSLCHESGPRYAGGRLDYSIVNDAWTMIRSTDPYTARQPIQMLDGRSWYA